MNEVPAFAAESHARLPRLYSDGQQESSGQDQAHVAHYRSFVRHLIVSFEVEHTHGTVPSGVTP
jgi:hypothetical protein